MPEPTTLHARIIDIIEAEWLRPFDPGDHAGDTPGARAYDAARQVDEALQDELDRRKVDACALHQARVEALEFERDSLFSLLEHVRTTLTRWDRPYATAHAGNCMHAVAELRALLNPEPTEETPTDD